MGSEHLLALEIPRLGMISAQNVYAIVFTINIFTEAQATGYHPINY
jgi:hypothetical protein